MKANNPHMKAMKRVMTYCVNTRDYGMLINPKGEWNGKIDNNQFFEICGISDSDYAKDTATRKSVSGYVVFLNQSLISANSKMKSA
jgi:hypothetical protein